MATERILVGETADFEKQTVKRVDYMGHRVVVVRIADDFYAIGDRCSHANYSLSEGDLYPDELEIECWKHGSTFSLVTGKPQTLPAVKPVPVYVVVVEAGSVYLEIPIGVKSDQ